MGKNLLAGLLLLLVSPFVSCNAPPKVKDIKESFRTINGNYLIKGGARQFRYYDNWTGASLHAVDLDGDWVWDVIKSSGDFGDYLAVPGDKIYLGLSEEVDKHLAREFDKFR